MMCFALNCKHYKPRDGCAFFRFPKNEEIFAKWVELIGRDPTKYSQICSCHFEDGDKNNLPTIKSRVPTPPRILTSATGHPSRIKRAYVRAAEAHPSPLKKPRPQKAKEGESNTEIASQVEHTPQQILEIKKKYDDFGKYVGTKLLQIDSKQRVFVERIIHETLFEGAMHHLNVNSKLVVNTQANVTEEFYDAKASRVINGNFESKNSKEFAPGFIKVFKPSSDGMDGSSDAVLDVGKTFSILKTNLLKRKKQYPQLEDTSTVRRIRTKHGNSQLKSKNRLVDRTQKPYFVFLKSPNPKRSKSEPVEKAETQPESCQSVIKYEIEIDDILEC